MVMMKYKMKRMFSLLAVMMFTLSGAAEDTIGDVVTTVADEGTSGMFVATLCPKKDVAFDKTEDLEAFSIYTDSWGKAYLMRMRIQDGTFVAKAGDCVIIKTTEPTTIPLVEETSAPSSVWDSNVFCPSEDMSVEDFLSAHPLNTRECIYLLTNMAKNGGFGFTKFTGDLMKQGNFFIIGRDNNPTAINANAVSDEVDGMISQGPTYDLLGRQVTPSPGQLLIQKGRKFVTGKSQPGQVAVTRAAEDVGDGDPVPFLEGEAGNDDGFTSKIAYAKVKLSKSKAVIENGKSLTLKATITPSYLPDKTVTWKSSNKKVATVTSKGKVKGVKAGTATITCTSNLTGAKAICKVTVGYVELDKTEAVINKGKTVALKATVYPSKLEDKSVTWESSNTKVATVSGKGKVKGVKAGTATITCTSNATGLKTACEVTVGYVKLDQSEVSVKKGKAVTLKAAVYPSTLEDRSVTWTSSNKKVATVSSKGKVKGVKAGTATITCTSNATGLSTTCVVTVKAASGIRSLEEDDDDEVTEIDEVEASAAIKPFDVFDLSGHKVLHQVTSLDGLPDGIYIVNGKKILKKN